MPHDLDVDYIVDQYRSGRSQIDIARELGVGRGAIKRRLKSRNIEIRSPAEQKRINIENLDELAERYQEGESMQALATEVDANRSTLKSRFKNRGIDIRSGSEAQKRRWERVKAEGRTDELVGPAHEGRRGQTLGRQELLNRAQGIEDAAQEGRAPLGRHENALASKLRSKGLSITQQRAVGPYNIDVAIDSPPIAVEVLSRHLNRKARRVFRDRMKCLFSRDWAIAYIFAFEWADVSIASIAEQLVTLTKSGGTGPPAINGRYWVIGSDGEFVAFAGRDLDNLARILTPDGTTA